jgi:zinc protease
VQRLTVADLEQERASAAMVARKVGLREFFGANHPYGRPTSGTVQTVKDLKVDDLKAAHAAIYQPQNATFFVAGSLDEAAVKAGLERAFAGWRGTGTAVAATPTYAPPANEKLRVVLVDKPGAVQTVVRFYMPAPVYNDPNRIKLNALGTILGGTFTSRLNTNLREEKGYTYGAGSGYSFEPHVGYLTANAEVRTDVTGASIKEFLNEFRKIRAGDVTDAEVAKAVSSGRTDTINAMATLGGILGTAMSLHLNGQPFSALAEELRAMQAIKASDINGLANPGIPLERGVLVLVGDKSAILPQLKDLGLPNPVEVKAD